MNSEKLQIQKWVAATPEQVFRAWTDPEKLLKWWGPKDVNCIAAEVDLRIGGAYRIANQLPDGNTLWISGAYEVIKQPSLLVYTWILEVPSPSTERVSVEFKAHDHGTMINLVHEKIPTKKLLYQHSAGWDGCLTGLIDHLQATNDLRGSALN